MSPTDESIDALKQQIADLKVIMVAEPGLWYTATIPSSVAAPSKRDTHHDRGTVQRIICSYNGSNHPQRA